jgi:serine/threonine protein kinase/tetratricopeptide (TPR) repeat protein
MSPTPSPETLSVEALVSQVADEFMAQLNRGEQPDVEEYARRHPQIASFIRQVLPALQAVRCPSPNLSTATDRIPPQPPLTGYLGDYRLLREVGRGGMGVVYEAEQISLGRRVALKVLPFATALDGRQLQRFKNEAQAAAHLHHQNIVPVYAVGCERGVHYYAMQFIDGQTLAEVIADLRLPIADCRLEEQSAIGNRQSAIDRTPPVAALSTERSTRGAAYVRAVARLGIQAAEALEYAHQQGIVHRDIKPANLLVDGRGNVWITDFGLAQCRGETRLTMTGDVLGTLRYMSPEQARARHAVVDQRTDIYSLGATLYELLTLQPIFAGASREELLLQIGLEEPQPLGGWNRAIPADLETIVLKALAKDPEERYATAQELADDLERFLQDVPIRAKRPTLRQRLAKWARRHRAVVGAAALVLVVAIVALTVSTLAIWRKQVQTRAALQAEARAHAAEAEQRRRAEKNVRLALAALEKIYLQVAEQRLPRDPQREREDRQLFRQVLAFYEDFAQNNVADPAVQAQIGKAYQRVGDIYQKLGHAAKAAEAYGRAIAVWQKLAADLPHVAGHRQQLALCRTHLGVLLDKADRPREAETDFRQALTIQKKLAADCPDQAVYRQDIGRTSCNLGALLAKHGRHREAEEAYRRAKRLYEQLVKDCPKGADYQHDLAGVCTNLGNLLATAGRLGEAERGYVRAGHCLAKLAAQCRTRPTYVHDLAVNYLNLGVLFEETGRLSKAGHAYDQARQLCEKLASDFPAVPAYPRNLAGSLGNLAIVRTRTGRLREAEAAWRRALALREKLVANFPAVFSYKQDLAKVQRNLGSLWLQLGRTREAEPLFRRAVKLLDNPVLESAGPAARAQLVNTMHMLGGLLAATGRPAEAEKAYRQAVLIGAKLAADFPVVLNYRHDLALNHDRLGRVLRDTNRPQEAERALTQARILLEKLAADFPTRPRFRESLAAVHRELGILWDAGQPRKAEQAYRQALALQNKLAEALPNVPDYRGSLAVTYHNLGILLQRTGRRNEAALACHSGLALLEKLPAEVSDTPDCRERKAALHNSLGVLWQETRQLAKAEKAYRQALALLEKLAADFAGQGGYQGKLATTHLNLGNVLVLTGRLREAEQSYRRGVKCAPANPVALDKLAWLLATSPDPHVQNAAQAIPLAKKAVELVPQVGAYWKTLGVAYFNMGDWKAGIKALEKALTCGHVGDSSDWFYLALAHGKLGDRAKAERCYRHAVQWMEENRPADEALRRCSAKVAVLLGLENSPRPKGKEEQPD